MRSICLTLALGALLSAVAVPVAEALTPAQERAAAVLVPRAAARWAPLIDRYFSKYLAKAGRRFTGMELRTALYVVWLESGGRVLAHCGSCVGIFQCQIGHFNGRRLWSAVSQVATAAMLYVRCGWWPWTTRAKAIALAAAP